MMSNKKLIISGLLLVLILPLGYFLGDYLLNRYQNESQKSIRTSFIQLSTTMKNIQKELESDLDKNSKNIHLIASINLIENYEDSEHYDKALFDEEKKRVIDLLKQLHSKTQADSIGIYDTTNRLVTLIGKENMLFSSYENFQRVYFTKEIEEDLYKQKKLSNKTESLIKELSLFTSQDSSKKESVYDTQNNILRIKSKTPIIRQRSGSTDEIVGYMVLLKEYTQSYLTTLILPKMTLTYSTEPKKPISQSLKFTASGYSMPNLFSTQALKELLIQEQNDKFFSRVEFPLRDEKLLIRIEAP